jgi:hypothetical protein
MTKWRAVAHLGLGGGGWRDHNSNQPAFVPAFSSTHSASCAVQESVCPLIRTALTLNRPYGTQMGNSSTDADSSGNGFENRQRKSAASQIALQLFYVLKESGMEPYGLGADDVLFQVVDEQGLIW